MTSHRLLLPLHNLFRWMRFGCVPLISLSAWAGNVSLVPAGSNWRYEASGTDLGTAWREVDYDDTTWPSGPARLGYGGDGELTVIPRTSPVYPTYYFRHSFDVATPAAITGLTLRLVKDDGCVVYLNGQEITRYNLKSGPIVYTDWSIDAADYTWEAPLELPNTLRAGKNVIAVEVHQCNTTSSDLGLDLELMATKPNISVILNSPADGAVVGTPATLTATASSAASSSLNVSFYGREWRPAVPRFTIAVIPDTQNYTAGINGGSMAMLNSQIQWIKNNRDALNIVYVAQEGDLSQNGDTYENEWINASSALYQLEAPLPNWPAGIPYGAAVGNHDQIVPGGDTSPTTYFNKYFGVSHFEGRSYYGGHFDTANNNSYQLFSASGMDFIVITLEYSPSSQVLAWADSLLKTYPGRRAILVTHSLLETTAAWTGPGLAIYNALKGNSNLFLMLCGHNHGEARRTDVYDGNTVQTVLADYQSYPGGGNGFMRLLEFAPSDNAIQFTTYSPFLNQYEVDGGSQFALPYAMTEPAPFTLVQQKNGVNSGTESAATWSGLQGNKVYEWYVVADDGLELQSSVARTFTTTLNSSPSIQITRPLEDLSALDSLTASVTIAAVAGDTDGSVTGVEFFANGVSLGTELTAPFEATFDLSPGTYSLTAVATDNQGATAMATGPTVTVSGIPFAPSILQVVQGSVTVNSVQMSWKDDSSAETDYEVLLSTDGTAFTTAATLPANTTGTTLNGLAPATLYWFKVAAINTYGAGISDVVSAQTALPAPPLAPIDVGAEAVSSTEIVVHWTDNSIDETGFEVWISTGGPYVKAATVGPNALSTTVGGLQPYTTYWVEVRAVNAGGSNASSPTNATTEPTPTPPSPPTGLVAAPFSNTEITLTWVDGSTDESGFRIERSSDGANWTTVVTTSQNETSALDTELVSGTVYYYRAIAFKDGAESTPSGTALAAPFVDSYAISETLLLGTLTGSLANTVNADQVYEQLKEKLTGSKSSRASGLEHTWMLEVPPNGTSVLYLQAYHTPNSEGDDFVLEYSTDNVSFGSLTTVIATTPADDPISAPLPSGVNGSVLIRARDIDRTSGRTSLDTLFIDQLLVRTDVTPRPPVAPSDVQAVPGDSSVTLNWSSSAGTINIYRSDNGAQFVAVATGVVGNTYTDTGLSNGSTYKYYLTASNALGESAQSQPIVTAPQASSAPEAPQNLTATSAKRKITLTWTQSSSAGLVVNTIYRSENGVDFTLLAQVTPTTSYVDSVPSGATYYYQVTASTAAGESDASLIVTATSR